MLVMRFYHMEEELHVSGKVYRATCKVRNEINGRRKPDQVAKTYPITSSLGRLPYMPRKFPTGTWKVKRPEYTSDMDYWPVKIPTDAIRRVLNWNENSQGEYEGYSGEHQDDAFYHLHYAKESRTTLGCIRLDSERDAREIAGVVESYLDNNLEVWIEVMVHKGE